MARRLKSLKFDLKRFNVIPSIERKNGIERSREQCMKVIGEKGHSEFIYAVALLAIGYKKSDVKIIYPNVQEQLKYKDARQCRSIIKRYCDLLAKQKCMVTVEETLKLFKI
jgi:hypothetical protein